MKILLLLILTTLTFAATAQVLCIECYDQNAPVLTNTNNLIVNGGFENSNCLVDDQSSVFCPNSNYYSCNIPNWTCTGGGYLTYAHIIGPTWASVGEGIKAAYMGNHYANSCSNAWNDTSCISNVDCQVMGIPAGYPYSPYAGYAGDTGVSLEQTINGLIPGNNYLLEFWAGGEGNSITKPGLFAVDVGFGKIFLREPATPPSFGIGKRFVIKFIAASSAHTIKFTNWGHIYSSGTYQCTELVLDDVRLFADQGKGYPCTPTALDNILETKDISIFPNPFSSQATLQTNHPFHNATLTVDNSFGQTIKKIKAINGPTVILLREHLPAGLYFIRLTENDKLITTGKLLIVD